MKKRKKRCAVIAAAVSTAVISAAFVFAYFYSEYDVHKQYQTFKEELLQQARDAERWEKQQAVKQSVEEKRRREEEERRRLEEERRRSEHDWDALKEQNPDIYAWLSIPDLELEYPVLQNARDDFYLNHNVKKEAEAAGSIYSNSCNRKDFSDINSILYGHNMKNGTMFGRLSEIRETDLAKDGKIYLYTEEKKLTYHVWAAVEFSDVYIPDAYGVRSKDGLESFLKAVEKSPAYFKREDMELSREDKILTLSTCVGGNRERRCIVVARLEN